MLLKAGANVESADKCGWRPLHYAAFHGHETMVDWLLAANADVCASTLEWADNDTKPSRLYTGNKWKGHPIHLAAMAGNQNIMQKLLDHGADVFATTGIDTEKWYFPGHGPTALHIALDTGLFYGRIGKPLNKTRLWIAQMLVDRGADVNTVADHLQLDDVMCFEKFEGLWDKIRAGISEKGAKVSTVPIMHLQQP
ncbi:hypothetical protein M422DRAFT_215370 [Sphaerobolus stellatus SS14]|uniref:Uncharacterized protein n=1 Tax=Sphaerobolus stellatus (strain SS14) TaxID=990650 RepID=A0A0C9UTK9_SPHS4|nr:hypothetical protein M422DRAFT_215370 [Sphaerobolus stellatus SS14]